MMNNEFELRIYDKNLVFQGVIDDFKSLRWRRKYFEAGEFELYVTLDDNILRFLKEDYIIVRTDALEAGIIESFIITDDSGNGNEAVAHIMGRFLSSILDRRIVKSTIKSTGTYLDGERKILNAMSPFSKLVIENSNIPSSNITFYCTYKNVYKYLNKLARASTIAHRIVVDLENKKFVYQNYIGLDRTEDQIKNTRYEFSEDRCNLDTVEYSFSSRNKKNYALVGGEGQGSSRVLVTVKNGDHTDFDLRETFVNETQEQKDEEMTDAEYRSLLTEKGKEKMLDDIESINVSVYSFDYKINWDLGDIVNVKKESWGIAMKLRIYEVEEIIEDKKMELSVVLGSPISEALADDEED